MKVLHVVYNCYPDETGGAVRTRYLVQTQARLGLRPVVLSSPFQAPADPALHHGVEYFQGIPHYRCHDGSDPARFMAAGKSWRERAAKLVELVPFARRIREVALHERVDVIHAHSLFLCGLAAIAAGRPLGLPVVYEVRSLIEEGMDGAGPLTRSGYRMLDRLACCLASHVTVACDGLRREMMRRGVAETKLTVAGNGVDLDAHRPLPSDGRAREFVVGYIGTLVPYEGLDLLLDAAACLAPRYPQLRVLLVGDGNARAGLEQQARRLGLDGIVRFAGRVPHDYIASYYEAIDLFVLPRRAGRITDAVTPLKPLEIMAHGKALLAGDCGGHRELVIDGVNGALFRSGDATDLERRIEEWIAAPAMLAQLGRQARRWVEQHRSWDTQCRPVVELYRRLAALRPGVLLVAPTPRGVATGGVETGVGLILRSPLAERHHIRVWDRRSGRRFLRFAAHVALHRPRVVHVKSSSGVNFVESVIYAAIARLLGRRVLFQLHGGDFEGWYKAQPRVARWALRRSLRWPHQILVLSEYWRDLMSRLAPGRPIQVVPNGVETPVAAAPHSNGTALRVLTIATLGHHKGHFEILDAAALLRGCPVRFLLAGPDETSGRGDGEQVRLHAKELRLGDAVEFVGPVGPDQKWNLLANADVFVLPSRAEGMPNAVLEAMAAGLPVVATPVGALPEMLPDGVFVSAGDPDGLARALLALHQDPARRQRLGRQNRALVEARYSFTRVEQLLDALYR